MGFLASNIPDPFISVALGFAGTAFLGALGWVMKNVVELAREMERLKTEHGAIKTDITEVKGRLIYLEHPQSTL